jgi:hypothetical protein
MSKIIKGENKRSRKQLVIDWKLVDELFAYGCNGVQIAARLGIHPQTLYDRTVEEKKTEFSVYMQEKRSKGETCLRETQFKLAQRGNVQMLIWLGKERLGQKDKSPEEVASNNFSIHINEIPK